MCSISKAPKGLRSYDLRTSKRDCSQSRIFADNLNIPQSFENSIPQCSRKSKRCCSWLLLLFSLAKAFTVNLFSPNPMPCVGDGGGGGVRAEGWTQREEVNLVDHPEEEENEGRGLEERSREKVDFVNGVVPKKAPKGLGESGGGERNLSDDTGEGMREIVGNVVSIREGYGAGGVEVVRQLLLGFLYDLEPVLPRDS
ncbi:unnamed protein product [Fraxinus pennsylvanica]|uniref:Uncharacterized protein n=1 Tax=Fraxinus pennsylvanica TaxID=56036 RepID=A0AAD2E5Z2_9LAMI|nr:unnamed protein product [Fraxinus pennsylvanica]